MPELTANDLFSKDLSFRSPHPRLLANPAVRSGSTGAGTGTANGSTTPLSAPSRASRGPSSSSSFASRPPAPRFSLPSSSSSSASPGILRASPKFTAQAKANGNIIAPSAKRVGMGANEDLQKLFYQSPMPRFRVKLPSSASPFQQPTPAPTSSTNTPATKSTNVTSSDRATPPKPMKSPLRVVEKLAKAVEVDSGNETDQDSDDVAEEKHSLKRVRKKEEVRAQRQPSHTSPALSTEPQKASSLFSASSLLQSLFRPGSSASDTSSTPEPSKNSLPSRSVTPDAESTKTTSTGRPQTPERSTSSSQSRPNASPSSQPPHSSSRRIVKRRADSVQHTSTKTRIISTVKPSTVGSGESSDRAEGRHSTPVSIVRVYEADAGDSPNAGSKAARAPSASKPATSSSSSSSSSSAAAAVAAPTTSRVTPAPESPAKQSRKTPPSSPRARPRSSTPAPPTPSSSYKPTQSQSTPSPKPSHVRAHKPASTVLQQQQQQQPEKVRRSGRRRIEPLQYWRNERIVYTLVHDEDGDVVPTIRQIIRASEGDSGEGRGGDLRKRR
ncbi:hypothetical protein BZA70DRAFT_292827 [Myxozyma melibiosi]|uniref:Uncharacterized protein n=1 Tax=Myxozyma melibiosi TaxID=54550 RepID=A0ABR1FC97_9ASCO